MPIIVKAKKVRETHQDPQRSFIEPDEEPDEFEEDLDRVKVPNVLRLSEYRAEKLIEAAELRVGNITYEPTPGQTPGTVLRQVPAAGKKVYIRQSIDLVICKEQDMNAVDGSCYIPIPPQIPAHGTGARDYDEEDDTASIVTIERADDVSFANSSVRVLSDEEKVFSRPAESAPNLAPDGLSNPPQIPADYGTSARDSVYCGSDCSDEEKLQEIGKILDEVELLRAPVVVKDEKKLDEKKLDEVGSKVKMDADYGIPTGPFVPEIGVDKWEKMFTSPERSEVKEEPEGVEKARDRCLKEIRGKLDSKCFKEKGKNSDVLAQNIELCLCDKDISKARTHVIKAQKELERLNNIGNSGQARLESLKRMNKGISIFLVKKELDSDCFKGLSEILTTAIESIRIPFEKGHFIEACKKVEKIGVAYGRARMDGKLKEKQQVERHERLVEIYKLLKHLTSGRLLR